MGARSTVAKWGASLAVRIPKAIAEQWGVREGSAVIAGQGGHIAVAIRGAIHWRTAEGGESCLFDLALETTETDASGSFTGTLTGRACGDTVIPLSAVELLQPAAK